MSKARCSTRCPATSGRSSPICARSTPICTAHPGKKLLFMGGEFGQWDEWKFAGYLAVGFARRHGLDGPLHAQFQRLVRDLNGLCGRTQRSTNWISRRMASGWIDGCRRQQQCDLLYALSGAQREPLLVRLQLHACSALPLSHGRAVAGALS